ncbi:MAG: glycine oxidase ThiO [Acidobacteriaceae bacterium]
MTGNPHCHSADNDRTRASDIIIVGAGVIGLSLSLELALRDPALALTVLERGEPGREASWAAAGMISPDDPANHMPTSPLFKELARYSARLYPDFVRQIEHLSGQATDYSAEGALYVSEHPLAGIAELTSSELVCLDPALAATFGHIYHLREASVDPRALVSALLTACRKQNVAIHHEHEVLQILIAHGSVTGVRTRAGEFRAPVVINCAGAWANSLSSGPSIPVVPAKGQMLAVLPAATPLITHTIRSELIYFLPRADGHIVIGATVEDAGYDKRVQSEVIQRLLQLAANLVPALGQARITDNWAGLRPDTPDHLPLLGCMEGATGYFLSTGHYRNGILLAPASAKLMAQLILKEKPEVDLRPFSPARFA